MRFYLSCNSVLSVLYFLIWPDIGILQEARVTQRSYTFQLSHFSFFSLIFKMGSS